MYIAPLFNNQNSKEIFDVIKEFSFATLISKDADDDIFVSHIPVLPSIDGDKLVYLTGHLAQRNPHVNFLRLKPEATIIFHGPHTYISPTWYRSGRDVPTWNYVVVHVKGKIEFADSHRELVQLLAQTSQKYEGNGPDAWKFELPADLKDESSLMSAIIGFQMKPTSIEAKFKLGQNRSAADRQGVSEGLSKRTDDMSLQMKSLIDLGLAK